MSSANGLSAELLRAADRVSQKVLRDGLMVLVFSWNLSFNRSTDHVAITSYNFTDD